MERVSTVPTVAVDLFRGLLTVIFLGVSAFSILIIVVVVAANYSSEAGEQAKWCAEYMPEASRSECATEAGW